MVVRLLLVAVTVFAALIFSGALGQIDAAGWAILFYAAGVITVPVVIFLFIRGWVRGIF